MNLHQSDHIEMIVPAKPEYVGVVRLTVSGIANRLGFTYDEIEDIKIAVAEACTNAVTHAYQDEGLIKLSFHLYSNRMEISIADKGQSFDVDGIKECLGPVDAKRPVGDLKEGGLGLFLINTLMDKVEIMNESGVVLIMTKFLQEDGVEQSVNEFSSAQSKQG